MQNLQDDLIELLKDEDNLVVEGQLNKNKIIEAALKIEPSLIKLLIQNQTFKKHFFQEVEGVLVFDKIKFQRFVSNKSFLPDSYTAFKNKIGLAINDYSNDNFIKAKNDVVLAWAHKDCVLVGGQTKEDQKRNEIFYNETLAPDSIDRLLDAKAFTSFTKYDKNGEQVVTGFTGRENLILKGNNLLAISSLLKTHRRKIKFIYIDPPFNTEGDANTFWYNNTFNHSTWLTFMKNRLEIAKELLADDGVISIAIDDSEQAYLQVLADDIFGRENNLGTLIVQNKPSGRTTDAYFATCHEYTLFYAKNNGVPKINFTPLTKEQKSKYTEGTGDDLYKWRDFLRTGGFSTPKERPNSYYPIFYNEELNSISVKKEKSEDIEILPLDSNGVKRVWRKTIPSLIEHIEANEIKVEQNNQGQWKVRIIDRIKKGQRPKSVWTDSKYDASSHGTKLLKNLFDGEKVFSYPKSIHAVKDIIYHFTNSKSNDFVLDFFGGSGTTAHAVLELNKEDSGNRKFIVCEQMDYVNTVINSRLIKVISENKEGSFVYAELMQYNQYFVTKIQEASAKEDLLAIWGEMQDKAFLSYQFNRDVFNERLEAFKTASLEMMQQYLIEVLDKNQLYVNYSEIEDSMYKVSEEDKALNYSFYNKKE
ncbi:DNA methyltransferase [Gelidibacter japonicus]|uniref:DNA methyltransferase n=1 Tax=Gelidibacter japonicus TaxID=1962232 RepID=UPI003A913C40